MLTVPIGLENSSNDNRQKYQRKAYCFNGLTLLPAFFVFDCICCRFHSYKTNRDNLLMTYEKQISLPSNRGKVELIF